MAENITMTDGDSKGGSNRKRKMSRVEWLTSIVSDLNKCSMDLHGIYNCISLNGMLCSLLFMELFKFLQVQYGYYDYSN